MSRRGRPRHPDILTPREWEVLALLRKGLSNPEIADRLGISRDGVKFHVSEILTKLGVTSREEAASWSVAEIRRPWWMTALGPVGLLWRKAGWAIGGALLVAAVAGLALLAVLLLRGGSSAPVHHELAYLGADGALWLYNADSGEKRKLADVDCGLFPQLAWSPNGRTLSCAAPEEGSITLIDATTGDMRRETGFQAADPRKIGPGFAGPYWSPNGDRLIYVLTERHNAGGPSAPNHGDLVAVVYASGAQRQSVETAYATFGGAAWASWGFPLWSPDGTRLLYYSAATGTMHLLDAITGEDADEQRAYVPLAWSIGGQSAIVAVKFSPRSPQDGVTPYEANLLDLKTRLLTRLPQLDNGVQFWVAPDGGHAAYATFGQRSDGLPSLAVLDLNTRESTPIGGSLITYGSDHIPQEWVRFSEDGKYIYWVGGDNAGYRANIDGSGLTKLLDAESVAFSWSRDFSQVAYTRFDASSTSLVVADADGRNAKDLTTREGTAVPIAATWRP